MISVSTDLIPDRQPDQDEAVVLIVLRRTDPVNESGGAESDLTSAVSIPDAAFTEAVIARCEALGFDPAQTYMAIPQVTNVEATGAITLTDLQALVDFQQGTPPWEG